MTEEPGRFEPTGFEDRVGEVRRRIEAASSDPGAVRIVAVTKGFGLDAVRAALGVGLVDVGENYADELVTKAVALSGDAGLPGGIGLPAAEEQGEPPTGATWHFLGAIQRNKVARLVPVVSWWQGLRRLEEGRAIASRRPGSTVLVQVDVAGIPGRGGCRPDQVPDLVRALRDQDLDVAGLMAVGPPGPPGESRAGFREVALLADSLDLPVRSMGMSDDFEVAVSEGSTMVRLGRALFGDRAPKR